MPSIDPTRIENPIHPEEIYSMDDLLHYQHQRLGPSYEGVPGISIPAFNFSLLDSLLSKAARIDQSAFQDLIIVPDGDHLFVTTHLEARDAGQQLCAILTRVSLYPLEQEFAENFRLTILNQQRNHWLWQANGGRIFQLKLAS